jgi:RNA polymerase sigma factor (sigma-70 family)
MADAPLGILLRELRGLFPGAAAAVTDSQLLERFCAAREEAAFAGLLRRHGPMVLGVCRRVLGNLADAEDVFQATFLLLARKAASIRKGESVSSWLHAVAFRLALKSRTQAQARRRRERQATELRRPSPEPQTAGEWDAALDEELDKLPARYRAPLVLCYLEGKTQEEARRRLGCPLGTVRSRLARGRRLLRERLRRRGMALSALAVAADTPAPALPAPLFHGTLKAGLRFAAGMVVGGNVSARVAALVELGQRLLATAKLKTGIGLLLLVGLLTAGALAAGHRPPPTTPPAEGPGSTRPKDTGQKPAAKPNQSARNVQDGQVAVTGRVLDPKGKPASGARVTGIGRWPASTTGEPAQHLERVYGNTRTDRQGRFRLSVPPSALARLQSLDIIAAGPGYGLGWKNIHHSAVRREVTIRLRPEQVFRGRLLDVQGQPAAKVRLHLLYVADPRHPLDAVGLYWWKSPGKRVPFSSWPGPVTTDDRGRFTLRGLGRDMLFGLWIGGDERYGRQDLHDFANKDGKEVTRLLDPPHLVDGRVTGADTGKAVPGARLQIEGLTRAGNQPTFVHGAVDTRADARGHFRVVSYPGNTVVVYAFAPAGTPYLGLRKERVWPKAAVRQQVDLALPKGVLVRGKVTEARSGKPLARVRVEFWPQKADNPHFRADAVTGWGSAVLSDPDGTFRIAVLPGPGTLLFQSEDRNCIQQVLYHKPGPGRISTRPIPDPTGVRSPYPQGQPLYVDGWHALMLKPDARPPEINATLRRGRTVHGRLLGPDGKAVARAQMICRLPQGSLGFITLGTVEVGEGRFALTGCDPAKTYPVYFLDRQHQWGATAWVRGTDKSVVVRLAPCGSAVTRLVDKQGRPVPNQPLNAFGLQLVVPPAAPADTRAVRQTLPPAETLFLSSLDPLRYQDWLQTDARGRLTLPVLIPGATYRIEQWGQIIQFKAESAKVLKLADLH